MKMQIEIWSDVACPFCYLGKRKFEAALEQFEFKNDVQVVWRSFLLNPDLVTNTATDINTYLSLEKGIPPVQAEEMTAYVTAAGMDAGITFNFNTVVVANTRNAHLLLQLAARHNAQNAAAELLAEAYFTLGKNVDDPAVLTGIGKALSLPETDLNALVASPELQAAVDEDIYRARLMGIRGVPFFLFNNKYAVSGAREPEAFLQSLSKAFSEWKAAPSA